MKFQSEFARGILAYVTLAIGAYIAVSSFTMILECWVPVPVYDTWLELVSGRHITWSWLASQHAEHRVLVPRLVAIADYWLWAETNVGDFVAGIAVQSALAIVVVWLSRGAGLRNRVDTIWTIGLTLALLYWSVEFEALTWGPTFFQYFGVLFGAAAAFSVLALRPPTKITLIIVIGLELLTAGIMANGVGVAFLAVALAFWLDRPRTHLAILSLGAVSITLWYFVGYNTPPEHSNPLHVLSHVGATLEYATVYFGSAVGNAIGHGLGIGFPVAIAVSIGSIGLLLFAILAWGELRVQSIKSPHRAVLLALATFVVCTAFLTALGRAKLGIEQAFSGRYATSAGLFWLCLTLLLTGAIGPTRRKIVIMATALVAVMVIGTTQSYFVRTARELAEDWMAATPALITNVADPLLANVFPWNARFPLQERALLRSANTSVFSDGWTNWIGTTLSDHVTLTNGTNCQGSFEKALLVDSNEHPGWRALGIWLRPNSEASRKIVLVDGEGRVVGYGLGGLDLSYLIGQTAENAGWVGAFTSGDPGSVAAYVLLDGGSTACPLGTPRLIGHLNKVVLSSERPRHLSPSGWVDTVSVLPHQIVVAGWGMLQADNGTIGIETNVRVKSFSLKNYLRPDVVNVTGDSRLANSGILLKLDVDQPLPEKIKLCLWSSDPQLGIHLLSNLAQLEPCSNE